MGTPAEVLDEASEVFGSRARGLLALNLAKAWLSGIPLSASRLASIAGVGRGNTYKVLKSFVSSGLARWAGGGYVGSERLAKVASPLLEDVDPVYAPFKLLPDTAYYRARAPFREWLGPEAFLYIIDYRAAGLEPLRAGLEEGRQLLEKGFGDGRLLSWAFVEGLSGREVWGYGEDGVPEAGAEQAFADIFSFSPSPESFVIDLLWNLGRVDVDRVYRLCSNDRCRGLVANLAAAYLFIAGRAPFKGDYFRLTVRGPRDCYSGLAVRAEVRDNEAVDPMKVVTTTAIMWLIPDPVRAKEGW